MSRSFGRFNLLDATSAIIRGDSDHIRYLIKENMIDINQQFDPGSFMNQFIKGNTYLFHLAIYFANLEICSILLESGADVHVVNHQGFGLLDYVTYVYGFRYVYNSEWREKFIPICQLLVRYGADVNYKRREFNDSALYNVTRLREDKYTIEVVKLLIENGADVNSVNKTENRPLHNAIENNSVETIRLLLDAGVDLAMDEYSDYILWAGTYGTPEVKELLLSTRGQMTNSQPSPT